MTDNSLQCRARGVFVPAADALVIADLHRGRAATSNVDAPLDDTRELCVRIEHLLETFEPTTLIVAGDLLHSFSTVPRGVLESVGRIESLATEANAELIVTPGNHDTTIEEVYDGRQAPAYQLADGTVVCHGHEEPTMDAHRYIIGHDHPAIELAGRRYPCYLFGQGVYRGSDVLVCPAFTRLAAGVLVNRPQAFQSPLIPDIDAFAPAVWDGDAEETRWFPPLGECRALL